MKTEEEPFVRNVTLENENLTIVLATDNQLGDLARYSTSEHCSVRSYFQSWVVRVHTDFLPKRNA